MKVYVVEERYKDDDPKAHVEGDVIYITANEEKALEFIDEYIDHTNMYSIFKPSTYWWWLVLSEVNLDEEIDNLTVTAIFDWNGKRIEKQPFDGYLLHNLS